MKKFILLRIFSVMAIVMAITVGMSANNGHILVRTKNAGTPHQVEVSRQTKITFDKKTMQINHPEGNLTLDIADIERMEFDLITSSVDEIKTLAGDDVTITVNGKTISAVSSSGAALSMHVYSMTGCSVAVVTGTGSVQTDFTQQQSGIYIIICNNKTIKYINR